MIHAFEYRARYLVLDVESGAIHRLDRLSFEIVQAMEQGNDVYALPYSREDIDEVLSEIDELRRMGSFDSPAPEPVMRAAESSPIKSMCLNVAHDCNLRSGNRRHLEVDLFGGEPLMNFDVVKSIVAYGRELEAKFGKEIHFTITTNGMALDDEKDEFINSEMYNLVLSLDGRREVHDALRVTANGKGSYDIIVPKMRKLIGERGGREHYIRGTFTANNLDFTEDVRALAELGFEQISVEPVVLPESDPLAITEENADRAIEEYDRLLEYVIERREQGRPINFFHFYVDLDDSPCLAKRSLGCGAGVEYVAVAPNGDIFPCHQFVGKSEFRLGNVFESALDDGIRNRFAHCNVFTKPKCVDCWARYYCSGGCAANAYNLNGSIAEPPEISCRLLKKRTEIAIGMAIDRKEN